MLLISLADLGENIKFLLLFVTRVRDKDLVPCNEKHPRLPRIVEASQSQILVSW